VSRNNRVHQIKTPIWQKISLIIFGLFLTLAILEIGLRIGGFILLSLQERRNLLAIKQKDAYRIMCLGESTTAGQYPSFLEETLNERSIGIKFSVIDKGSRGTHTGLILSELEANLDKYNPDMVVTIMGINDFGTHIPYEAVSTSKIILFFMSFRTYKLARLLLLHIVTKAKESPSNLLKSGFKEDSARQMNSMPEDELFNKAIELTSKNDWAYVGLGRIYRDEGDLFRAEEAFKKSIALNPNNDWAYVGLGRIYRDKGKFLEAEEAFKKAIAINPSNDWAYVGAGRSYREKGKFLEAEEAFKKAIALNPHNDWAYVELAWIYRDQGKLFQIEALFKRGIELNPMADGLYAGLSTVYQEMGRLELAEEYSKKANELRLKEYSPITVNNYHKFKQILDKRDVRLVCVQYPMRSVESLKKIFPEQEGIIFVDNENAFKTAIKKAGYKKYFVDMFGSDFGHCTTRGNRLLAENIADAILKKVFAK